MTNGSSIFALVAAVCCAALAPAAVIRKSRSFAAWSFAVGMMLFSLESVFAGLGLREGPVEVVVFWQTLVLLTKSFLPAVWLAFSLTYSRANWESILKRSGLLIGAAFLIPVILLPGLQHPVVTVVAF